MDKLIQWLDKWFQSSGLYTWWQSKVAPADEPEVSTRTHIEQFAADTYPRLFNEFFGKRYENVGDTEWVMEVHCYQPDEWYCKDSRKTVLGYRASVNFRKGKQQINIFIKAHSGCNDVDYLHAMDKGRELGIPYGEMDELIYQSTMVADKIRSFL